MEFDGEEGEALRAEREVVGGGKRRLNPAVVR